MYQSGDGKREDSSKDQGQSKQSSQGHVDGSLRMKQLASFQRMVDASPKVQRTAQLMSLQTNSDVVQRVINVIHSDHNESDDRASYVEAEVSGYTLPLGSNSPTVDPTGWDEIAEKYEMDDVYRMHLWNGRLGGPGDETWNLTPGVEEANTDMALEEVNAQAQVNAGNTVSLDTSVTYGYSDDDTDPDYYYPSHILFNWVSLDDDGDLMDEGTWDEDIPLPTEKDPDWDPDDPDDLGMDEEEY